MAIPIPAISVGMYTEEEGIHIVNAAGRFCGPASELFA
jgi:hypothetical protein